MTEEEARILIRDTLRAYPDLTYAGFGPYRQTRTLEERRAALRKGRRQMRTLKAIDEFQRSFAWLERQPRTKHVNRRARTCYSLKEEVEAESGYVSNGMFIAAAIACGYLVEQTDDWLNAWINISQLRPSNPNLELLLPHPHAARLLRERSQAPQRPPAWARGQER